MFADIMWMLGALAASRYLHNCMLARILRAPQSFFDLTPIGRLLSRFSDDLDEVDDDVPTLIEVVYCWMEV